MRMQHAFLSIVFLYTAVFSSAQDCHDQYLSNRFGIEICTQEGWSIEENSVYLIVAKGKNKISIYTEPADGDQTPQASWEEEWKKNKAEDSTWSIMRSANIVIDGEPAWMAISHRPALQNNHSLKKEIHNTSVVFFHEGVRYYINNNCYEKDCSEGIKLVEELCTRLKFAPKMTNRLSENDSLKLTAFAKDYINALQYNNEESFKKLLADARTMIKAAEQIRDKQLAERLITVLQQNEDSYNSEFYNKSLAGFYPLIEAGKKEKITWKEISFKEVRYDLQPIQLEFKAAMVAVSFGYKDKEYVVAAAEVLLLPDGWRITRLGEPIVLENKK